jgi:predicted transcriptional regulator
MKHVYHAVIKEQKTKGILLDRFVDSMYNGSASNLVLQLLGNKKTSKKELQAIKDMLSQLDKGNK